MAQAGKRLNQAPPALGFEALVAVLHIQAQVVRPIDDALERAHRTNITGYEVLARLPQVPQGASVRFRSLVSLTAKGQHELNSMRATFEQALTDHFLTRLTATQIRALTDIAVFLGAVRVRLRRLR